jgi:hypothetical protein
MTLIVYTMRESAQLLVLTFKVHKNEARLAMSSA